MLQKGQIKLPLLLQKIKKKAAECVLNLEPVVEAPKAISEVISEPQVVSEPEIVLEPEVVDTTVYQKEIVLHIEEN